MKNEGEISKGFLKKVSRITFLIKKGLIKNWFQIPRLILFLKNNKFNHAEKNIVNIKFCQVEVKPTLM